MRHVMIHLTPEERGTAVITKNVMSNWIGLLMDKYDERKRLRQLAPIQPDDEDDSYNSDDNGAFSSEEDGALSGEEDGNAFEGIEGEPRQRPEVEDERARTRQRTGARAQP